MQAQKKKTEGKGKHKQSIKNNQTQRGLREFNKENRRETGKKHS
jgi:hypothetical protein